MINSSILQFKTCVKSKDTIESGKGKIPTGKNMFSTLIADKGLIARTYKYSKRKKANNPILKNGQKVGRFTEDKTWMVNKYNKGAHLH